MSEIQTQRLLLRPWREADAAALYKYASDPLVGPPAGWSPHEDEAYSLNILRTVLMKENTWAVTIKGSDEPVGSIGYFPSDGSLANAEPEIGYWIGRPFWGQAYIPEAVRNLLPLCFQGENENVWCAHFAGNDKSRRVIEKCGFVYKFTDMWKDPEGGEDRETLFYSMSREAWSK